MSVYFIEVEGAGRVKIGYSADPFARRSALQTDFARRLVIRGILPGGRAMEREFHRRFARQCISGEVFRLEGALAEFVDALPPLAPKMRGVGYAFGERLQKAAAGDTVTYESPLDVSRTFRGFVRTAANAHRRGVMVVRKGMEAIRESNHDHLIMLLEDGEIYD